MIVKHNHICDHGNPKKKTTLDWGPSGLIDRDEKIIKQSGQGDQVDKGSNTIRLTLNTFDFVFSPRLNRNRYNWKTYIPHGVMRHKVT